MPLEYSSGKFVSFARHTRKALVNLVRSYEDNINSVMSQYGENKVMLYLGDQVQPHSPSVTFLAESDQFSWLATGGPEGGPQKDLIVQVQIIPQIKITDPEASEDAIQDLTAVVLAALERYLEFNVTVTADDDSALTWKVYDSLILGGLSVPYRYRYGKTYRASQITWQGKIDYLSPVIGSIASFSSNVTQADLDV